MAIPTVWEFRADENSEYYLLDYLGNQADVKGTLSEIDPPEIVRAMDQRPRAGKSGAGNTPGIFEAMDSTLTLFGITVQFKNMVGIAMANKKMITIQVTGTGYDPVTGNTAPMAMTLKGHVMKYPFFGVTSGSDSAEAELQLGVNAVGQDVAGESWYFEPMANRFEINGVNQWA